VGSGTELIIPLEAATDFETSRLGGKAVSLGRLIAAGYRVPNGFCISTDAYENFINQSGLEQTIRMELERKPLASMRWEEIWDAALRIRSAFLVADIPDVLSEEIAGAYDRIGRPVVAVRSSAPEEDSEQRSHAGLHESLVGVKGEAALLDAVRIVWASLWSDAALLYRRELEMDPASSRMAVVVQSFVTATPSGVGFGTDPREPDSDRQVVEAVPGPCEDMVSGNVDPDRWIMKRSSGEVVEWRAGKRPEATTIPLLGRPDLEILHKTLNNIEEMFGWTPDVEWTGKSPALTLLQARPVTRPADTGDQREWYLTLRPGKSQLEALCKRVTEQLVPALESEGENFANETFEGKTDLELAAAIESRRAALRKWKKIYWDDFIPFAHGVRQLGLYYNDAVRPENPYEFVGILRDQNMIAKERNAALGRLATSVSDSGDLRASLEALAVSPAAGDRDSWPEPVDPATVSFYREFDDFFKRYMDIAFEDEALDQRPDLVLGIVLKLAALGRPAVCEPIHTAEDVEKKLLEAVGPGRESEARDVISVGRLSWKLRDDDNILIGRLEHQVQRALEHGANRLRLQNRLSRQAPLPDDAADTVIAALKNPDTGRIELVPGKARPTTAGSLPAGETPRQLIGQPAAPGLVTGRARVVRRAGDIAGFDSGEILVCDAIQPTMTHVVPIAGGIVERRGGMLIHGAIIARELGVPCVNGVTDATELLQDGDLLTVDGYLGIVTVGPPEFDMERNSVRRKAEDPI
jgi:pyruvate,water dikinase